MCRSRLCKVPEENVPFKYFEIPLQQLTHMFVEGMFTSDEIQKKCPMLYQALKGLSRFAHVLSVEYFQDLLEVYYKRTIPVRNTSGFVTSWLGALQIPL